MKIYIIEEGEVQEIKKGEKHGDKVHLIAYAPNRMIADNWARSGAETQRTAYYKAHGHIYEIDRYIDYMRDEVRDMGDMDSVKQNYPDLYAAFKD